MDDNLQPGQILARGVARHLRELGLSTLLEFVPTRGLRVDVMAVAGDGELWIVECKSSRADFASDNKWQGYLPWCDRYFWAVDTTFPTEILPGGGGLMIADGYGAEIIRHSPQTKLAAARRKALMLKIARTGLNRLQSAIDPEPALRLARG